MTERVFLIGYRAARKTTVARLLAERLGWNWCDADHVLEQRFGTTIRQIFASEGEAAFRDKEAMVLTELAKRANWVIATGGGVVLHAENRERLKTGVTIWLTADPISISQRLQADATTAERRPDLAQGGLAEIEELLHLRVPLYQACVDWCVDTTKQSPESVAEQIAAWLQAQRGVDILKS